MCLIKTKTKTKQEQIFFFLVTDRLHKHIYIYIHNFFYVDSIGQNGRLYRQRLVSVLKAWFSKNIQSFDL